MFWMYGKASQRRRWWWRKRARRRYLTLRLKVANKKITEIETMVTRTQKEGALFKIDALQTADKNMECRA